MNKTIFALGALFCVATFSNAATQVTTSATAKSAIELLTQTPKWKLTLPESSCVEHYQFLNGQELAISSASQRLTANYQFIASETNDQLPALAIHFTSDNQKADCSGNSQSQTGITTVNFLKKQSDQKIYFCLDALGKDCPVYLNPEH